MRQRGPTATALSPGLYLDGHSARVPCANNSAALTPPVDVYADANITNNSNSTNTTATSIPSKLATISPVLSRIQSPHSRLLEGHMTSDVKQKPELSTRNGSAHLHAKLHRKHHKNRRIGLHQSNGDVNRSLQSLKVTIRRTSQSHKIDSVERESRIPGEAPTKTVLENPTQTSDSVPFSLGSTVPCDVSLRPLDPNLTDVRPRSNPCVSDTPVSTDHPPAGRTAAVNRVDAFTSTLDRSTLTDPDVLGPCEPGTKVVVEGVVWLEAAGMLVLNVQWRGRSYVGTLLDTSRQSFGPTCMDKGITSALSLLDGRRAWSYSPSGRFRSRGMHQHLHRHHRPPVHHRQDNESNGCMSEGAGARTTRAAAAAAAAAAASVTNTASASSTQNTDHESPEPSIDASRYPPSQDFAPGEAYFACRSQRGGKRRRRRGAANSRAYRRLPRRNTAAGDARSDSYQNTPNSSRLDDLDEVDDSETETEGRLIKVENPSAHRIACPYPDCQKMFDDLVSMRYHFSLGHAAQTKSSRNPEPVTKIENRPNVSEDTNVTDNEFICVDDPGPTSSPPPLGRAHEQVNASQEDCTEPMSTEDGFDNLEPPRLHRIVSITDSTNSMSQGMLASSPSKQGDGIDEPPAPSPAYSDISDDGTVPADQSTSFLDNYNMHLMSKLPANVGPALLSPTPTVFPTNSPRITTDSTLAVTVPTTSTTLPAGSPLTRSHPPPNSNGFYFPLNLLSPTRATLESGVIAPPSSNAVLAANAATISQSNTVTSHNNTTTAVNVSNCSPRAHTPLSLDPSRVRDRRTPQLPPPQTQCTVVSSQSRLPGSSPFPSRAGHANLVHIPGVNSFAPLPHELATGLGSDILTTQCVTSAASSPLLSHAGLVPPVDPNLRWCSSASPPVMSGHPVRSISSGPPSAPPPPNSSQVPLRANVPNGAQSFPLHSGSLRAPFPDGLMSNNHLTLLASRFPFVYRSK